MPISTRPIPPPSKMSRSCSRPGILSRSTSSTSSKSVGSSTPRLRAARLVDGLGGRGLGPPEAFRLAREPVVIGRGADPAPRSSVRRAAAIAGSASRRMAWRTRSRIFRRSRGDLVLDLPRGVHDRRGVQDAPVARHLIGPEGGAAGVRVGRRDPVPVGVVAGRQRLAHPGRPVAEPDVAIAATGVAELAEPPVFLRLDEGRARRVSHRRTA